MILSNFTPLENCKLCNIYKRLVIHVPTKHFIMIIGMTAEDEWYNKSLSALRMNSSHHANLAAPMLQYQT